MAASPDTPAGWRASGSCCAWRSRPRRNLGSCSDRLRRGRTCDRQTTIRGRRRRLRPDGAAGMPGRAGRGRRRGRVVRDVPGRAQGVPGSARRRERRGVAGDDRAPQGDRHHPRGGAARGSGGRRPGAPLRDVGGRPRPRPHCRARRTAAQTAGGGGLPLSGGAALSGGRGDHRRLGRRGPAGGRRRHRRAAKDLRAAGGARPQPVAPLGSPASRAQPAGEVRFTNSPSSVTRNVSRPPSPANCNGVTVPCTYKKIGEVTGNLTGLLAAKGITTPFDVQADSAPVIYVHGQPGPSSSAVRSLERAAARLTGSDLATGHAVWLTRYLADPAELKILHMITGDPKRTPTVIDFASTDFYLSSGSAT